MGNRQDVPSTARPVLPHVFHLSKAYSDSPFSVEGPSDSLNPRTQTSFTSKRHLSFSGFHPELCQLLLNTQFSFPRLSKFQACLNEKGHKFGVGRCEDCERHKDSSSGNWQLHIKRERKAEKYSLALQNSLMISASEPPRKDSI